MNLKSICISDGSSRPAFYPETELKAAFCCPKKNFFSSLHSSALSCLSVCRSVGLAFNADGPHYHFDIFPRNASILGWSGGSTESEKEGEETADALWIAIIEVAVVE